MPLGPSVAANMHELKEANKDRPAGKKRPLKQRVAIALSAARRAGGDVPPPPKTGRGQASRPPTFIGVGGAKGHSKAHPGFEAVKNRISTSQGVSAEAAARIVASGARKAGKRAVKANPRLKRVSGVK